MKKEVPVKNVIRGVASSLVAFMIGLCVFGLMELTRIYMERDFPLSPETSHAYHLGDQATGLAVALVVLIFIGYERRQIDARLERTRPFH